MDVFGEIPLWLLFVASILLFAVTSEAGHRYGLVAGKEANVATLEASVLGLLALMLSFTFAMAVTRYDERRNAILDEANDIGAAGLRATLLPAPHNAESLKLLREYIGIRVSSMNRDAWSSVDNTVAHSNDLQKRLWLEAKGAMAKDNGMAPTGLYIQALNDVFDDQEKRLTAFRDRVPRIVFLALYAIAAIGLGLSGYASGLERRSWRLPVYIVNMLVASVILLIQDIDRPDMGSIRVSAQPIIDTADALAGYKIDAEPSPAPVSAKAPEPRSRPGK